jgi:hypothetical protein
MKRYEVVFTPEAEEQLEVFIATLRGTPLRKWRCAIQLRSSSTGKDYEPLRPDGLGHPVLADILIRE